MQRDRVRVVLDFLGEEALVSRVNRRIPIRITDAAKAERAALAELDAATASAPPTLTIDGVLEVVASLGGMAGVLAAASPDDRAHFYEVLGVTARYDGTARKATLSIEIPRGAKGVSGGGLDAQRHVVRITRTVELTS